MLWVVQAVVAAAEVFPSPGWPTVEIGAGLRLLRLDDELHRLITGRGIYWPPLECIGEVATEEPPPESVFGSPFPFGFDETLAQWSVNGPVAYLEIEYVGVVACERVTIWRGGELVLDRLEWERGAPNCANMQRPVITALQELGVSGPDEVAAAGLDRVGGRDWW